jgi:hypothetical protein
MARVVFLKNPKRLREPYTLVSMHPSCDKRQKCDSIPHTGSCIKDEAARTSHAAFPVSVGGRCGCSTSTPSDDDTGTMSASSIEDCTCVAIFKPFAATNGLGVTLRIYMIFVYPWLLLLGYLLVRN